MPVSEVITAAQDGTRNALAKTELFSYAKNNDWTQLEKKGNRTEYGVYLRLQPYFKSGRKNNKHCLTQ